MAKEETYPIRVKGKIISLPVSVIGELIKKKMRQSRVMMELFQEVNAQGGSNV